MLLTGQSSRTNACIHLCAHSVLFIHPIAPLAAISTLKFVRLESLSFLSKYCSICSFDNNNIIRHIVWNTKTCTVSFIYEHTGKKVTFLIICSKVDLSSIKTKVTFNALLSSFLHVDRNILYFSLVQLTTLFC